MALNDRDHHLLCGLVEKMVIAIEGYTDRPSLRDQFAMAALTGIYAADGGNKATLRGDAALAYAAADAMMEERKRGK